MIAGQPSPNISSLDGVLYLIQPAIRRTAPPAPDRPPPRATVSGSSDTEATIVEEFKSQLQPRLGRASFTRLEELAEGARRWTRAPLSPKGGYLVRRARSDLSNRIRARVQAADASTNLRGASGPFG